MSDVLYGHSEQRPQNETQPQQLELGPIIRAAQQRERDFDPRATIELDVNKNPWVELGWAPSLYVEVNPDRQIELTNKLREASIPCDLDGSTGIIGYLCNAEQYHLLQSLAKQQDTPFQYTIGLSTNGDSRLRVFSTTGATSFTSSAVIAAVRSAHMESPLHSSDAAGYQLIPHDEDENGTLFTTSKQQRVKRLSIEEYFNEHQGAIPQPEDLPHSLLESLKEESITLEHAEDFHVFKIDVNGFSSEIADTLDHKEEALTYLTLVTDFLFALEEEIKNQADGTFQPHFGTWEGDALSVFIEDKYLDAIGLAFLNVLDQPRFAAINAKAVAISLGTIELRTAGKRANLKTVPGNLKRRIRDAEAYYKEHLQSEVRGGYVKSDESGTTAKSGISFKRPENR